MSVAATQLNGSPPPYKGSPKEAEARPVQPAHAVDTAARVLDRIGDQALEFPPKDLKVLAASVQKFLLTNLEPALEIARQFRDQATTPPNGNDELVAEVTAGARPDDVLALLTDDRDAG